MKNKPLDIDNYFNKPIGEGGERIFQLKVMVKVCLFHHETQIKK